MIGRGLGYGVKTGDKMKFLKRLFCNHYYVHDSNIYGDRINFCNGYRSVWKCEKCGKKIFRRGLFDWGEVSDGYHTFNELYEFRMLYNAALFNEWAKTGKYDVHKSMRHHDGGTCFGGGWFIVVAMLPTGQISNHYEMKHWSLFDVDAEENALFEFDGHTARDVAQRLRELCNGEPEPDHD